MARDRITAIQKIVSLLRITVPNGSTIGEETSARQRIQEICFRYKIGLPWSRQDNIDYCLRIIRTHKG
jgi:hypothetical protein